MAGGARPQAGERSEVRFTAEHEMFRQSVRRFVEQEINPHADEWEEAGIFPAHELFRKLGDLGFLGLTYPEENGRLPLALCSPVPLRPDLRRAPSSRLP